MKNILILNGSPSGSRGNCARFLKKIDKNFPKSAKREVIHLATTTTSRPSLKKKILNCDAVLFITGTYWDSWGSPLQKFFEDITDLEGHPRLMGKPTGVVVLMHSVGGKGVLSRLQGMLSTFGFLIPPMSGMVYSLVSDIALKSTSTHASDFWHVDDSKLIIDNLIRACEIDIPWTTWPVDKKDPRRTWIKS